MKNYGKMIVILLFLVMIIDVAPARSDPASRRTVIISCVGDPSLVISSQSSLDAPIVPFGDACADAIAAVLESPSDNINVTWQLTVSAPGKKTSDITTYTLFETVKGQAGPPGLEGPAGPAGTSTIDLSKIYQKICFDCILVACDNVADKVLGGGVACDSPGFTQVRASQPALSTSISPSLPCTGGSPCKAWAGSCESVNTAGVAGIASTVHAICIAP